MPAVGFQDRAIHAKRAMQHDLMALSRVLAFLLSYSPSAHVGIFLRANMLR